MDEREEFRKLDFQLQRRVLAEQVAPKFDDWICTTVPTERRSLVAAIGFTGASGPEMVRVITKIDEDWTVRQLALNTGVSGPLMVHAVTAVEASTEVLRAMARMMCARRGSTTHPETNFMNKWGPAQERFMDALWSHGPLDSFDGTGPGRPMEVHRDERGRLHNAEGPAMTFRGYDPVYALGGVYVTGPAWAVREDASEIVRLTNVEVRRALMQRMGLQRFFRESGMQPAHRDRFGTLYKLSVDPTRPWDRGNDTYVHVQCPSTKQDYILPVPPQCTTAHEAVAWTFQMVPEDYDPQQEA